MEKKKQFNILDGFKLFVLLMILLEVGAILSHLTFDRTILKFNVSVIIIVLLTYSYHFLYKKKEVKEEE